MGHLYYSSAKLSSPGDSMLTIGSKGHKKNQNPFRILIKQFAVPKLFENDKSRINYVVFSRLRNTSPLERG
jgi:hypothetical protein